MRYGRHVLKKSHQRPAVQVITASNFPFNTTMFDSEVCYIRHLLQQNHEDAATRFDMADICLETAAKTRFVACVVCHGYTICYGRHPRSATTIGCGRHLPVIRFVTSEHKAVRLVTADICSDRTSIP